MSLPAALWCTRIYRVLAAADQQGRRTLLAELRPRREDLAQIIAPGWCALAEAAYAPVWRGRGPDFPDARATTVRVEIGTADEHRRLAPITHILARGPRWGRVAPTRGGELDGLVFLDDRVVWLPKPRLFLGHALRGRGQDAMEMWIG